MKAFGLWLLFVLGVLASVFVSMGTFVIGLIRGGRAFHPQGTVCEATVTAIDGNVVGKRIEGPALVRLSGVSEPENSPNRTIIGFAMKLAGDQDLATASFESFLKMGDGTKKTNIENYLANEYASVAPWRTQGLGVVWYRAIGSSTATTGSRTERLDHDITNGTAKLVLEARTGPGAADVVAKVAEITLTKRLPDDPSFRISMWRSGRGISATGFRNGVRAFAYRASQLGRGLRGR